MELKQLIMDRPAWLTSSEKSEAPQIVLAVQLSLNRNLDKYPFSSKLSIQQQKEIFSSVDEAVTSRGIIGESPLSINLAEVSDIAKTLLFERDFLPISTVHANGDRGVVVGDNGVVVLINSVNHISLSQFCSMDEIDSTWESLNTADTLLGKEVTYAYSSDMGFLLNRPDASGSGFSISYNLHLPGLVHTGTLEQVLSGATQMGMNGAGKFRMGNESWGSLFTLSSTNFMGTNEEETLKESKKVIDEIVEHEAKARKRLFEEAKDEMEDKIWRSVGVLKYCRMLSVTQLLNLTSTIRLGLEEGMEIENLTVAKIDSMIASSLQGSVALLMEAESKDTSTLDTQRAEIVRTILE